MLERLTNTVNIMEKLPRWNGHFYNWYQTITLEPLQPVYVSMVDSGNLVVLLLAVKQGIKEILGSPPIETTAPAARQKIQADGKSLLDRLEALALAHDFTQLYDSQSRLFAIGYNLANKRLDASYYDLLASESRQTSFAAIALGQIPAKHWFTLNRSMILSGRNRILASWSGTMFEYLLPLLLMPSFPNALWYQTYRSVVGEQIRYAAKIGVPWGISESGYHDLDLQRNYQYQAFGLPGLSLKPGLENVRVIAPYATFLAAPLAVTQALVNLRRLEGYGALGEFGFYEAIDFTASRLPKGSQFAVIKSYMAHHQGMTLLSFANLLQDNRWQRRFVAEPRVEATEFLLQERIPSQKLLVNKKPLFLGVTEYPRDANLDFRSYYQINTLLPEARFLSNGKYLVMITNSGGFSSWGRIMLNHWVEDPIRDAHGAYFYIRNLTADTCWSPSYQPCRVKAVDGAMQASLDKITFTRTDGDIHTNMEICVAPELDDEVRRITLTNHGESPCVLEVTSYLELELAESAAYNAHPAFSKLFIETEFIPETKILLAHRRSEKPEEQNPWAFHLLHVEGRGV